MNGTGIPTNNAYDAFCLPLVRYLVLLGLSDPYVVIELQDNGEMRKIFKTSVIKATLSMLSLSQQLFFYMLVLNYSFHLQILCGMSSFKCNITFLLSLKKSLG